MTDFIFDWRANSWKILNGGGYTSKKAQFLEQMALVHCLLTEMHADKEEIYLIWRGTKPDSIAFLDPVEDDEEMREIFQKVFAAGKMWYDTPGHTIILYQSELDFLNNMVTFLWVKQYILALLCIYKFYGVEWAAYNSTIKQFCFSVTQYGRERPELIDKLSKVIKEYKPYEVSLFNEALAYRVTFVADEGEQVASIREPREVGELMKYLKCERVCDGCGKKFAYTSRSMRNNFCPECYAKKRSKQQYQCKKRRLARQDNS